MVAAQLKTSGTPPATLPLKDDQARDGRSQEAAVRAAKESGDAFEIRFDLDAYNYATNRPAALPAVASQIEGSVDVPPPFDARLSP
ncbi:hypothetical protein MRX96_009690 [Rhipicephalus microplus]